MHWLLFAHQLCYTACMVSSIIMYMLRPRIFSNCGAFHCKLSHMHRTLSPLHGDSELLINHGISPDNIGVLILASCYHLSYNYNFYKLIVESPIWACKVCVPLLLLTIRGSMSGGARSSYRTLILAEHSLWYC